MNNIDLMNFWIESANEDYDTMLYMKKYMVFIYGTNGN